MSGPRMTAPAPTVERRPPDWGQPLTVDDYAALSRSWITQEIADYAMLRRVNDVEGAEIIQQKRRGKCAGVLFPYYLPGEPYPRNYRIRRDHPDLVKKDGKIKEDGKYLSAPGAANNLYFPPGVSAKELAQADVPIVICEGDKKTLALSRLAAHESAQQRFIAVGVPGVWNWKGRTGKTVQSDGQRTDTKGPIPDLSLIAWKQRKVYIAYDADAATNEKVGWARSALARELSSRGAHVALIDIPENSGVKGIDDLLFAWGPERILELLAAAVETGRAIPRPEFECGRDGLYHVSRHGQELRRRPLTNFNARIIASIALDDGAEIRREFEIEAELSGRSYSFNVTSTEFTSLDWAISQIGPAATVYPRQREYARAAIQSTAYDAIERHVYAHTGWAKVGDTWAFLHAGGALGPAGLVGGVEVRLPGTLTRYELHLPDPSGQASAVRASLRLAALGLKTVAFPLLAAT